MGLNALRRWLIAAAALALVAPIFAPQLLAFPYRAQSHGSEVWSEAPLPQDQLDRVLGRAVALVAVSPLARESEPRHIFLTRGGWRWTWLTLQNRGSFALSRAIGEPVVVNRSDLAADRMARRAPGHNPRSLSGIIAHETCHGMERRAFGVLKADVLTPPWLREGYCDVVAQESTLNEAAIARLKAEGRSHPGIVYFEGRKRIEAELARTGGDVKALFARY